MADRSFPSYRLYKDDAGEWRWTYHAVNGRAIADSGEGYRDKDDALHGIGIMQGATDHGVYHDYEGAPA